ncbi:MFS transporter [Brevibacillus formosus]|uniref:MFS transporter n=1 Tax=Brevibacillus formosus TaxID=54913 RepID=A0A837KKJ6_9BACL|nr:MFS transporter [Brevibacillus formosus]KLH97998.1 sugar phosphate permease [Brevibacillus formosus]MED1957181.1 MFS transporter [Brevibacillus formosus]PSJ91426.1 MFS transporter [Brevibacillus formosus]GED57296.1 MFS transporter [Brevibacillus formosus]
MTASTGSLLRNKPYLLLLIVVFFMHMASYLVIPVFPVFLQKVRVLSLSQVGIILAAGSITYQIGSLAGGLMSDRWGKRTILALGALLQGCAMAGYHFSHSYGFFLLFSSVNGLGLGLLAPTIKAMIADEVDESQRTAAFSWRGILAHSGIIVAGLVITWMTAGGKQPFLVAAFVYGALAVFSRFILPDDRCVGTDCKQTPIKEYRHILTHRSFLLFSVISLLIWSLYAQFAMILPLRGEHVLHSATMIGLIWTINSLSVVVLQGLISRFVLQRINPYLSVTLGTILLGAGLTLMGWANHFLTLSGAAILFILGEMLFMPMLDSLVTHFAKEEWLGAYFGFSNFVSGLGTALGTGLGGAMVEKLGGVGSHYPWIGYGVITLFLAAILGLFALYAIPRYKNAVLDSPLKNRRKEGAT